MIRQGGEPFLQGGRLLPPQVPATSSYKFSPYQTPNAVPSPERVRRFPFACTATLCFTGNS